MVGAVQVRRPVDQDESLLAHPAHPAAVAAGPLMRASMVKRFFRRRRRIRIRLGLVLPLFGPRARWPAGFVLAPFQHFLDGFTVEFGYLTLCIAFTRQEQRPLLAAAAGDAACQDDGQ